MCCLTYPFGDDPPLHHNSLFPCCHSERQVKPFLPRQASRQGLYTLLQIGLDIGRIRENLQQCRWFA